MIEPDVERPRGGDGGGGGGTHSESGQDVGAGSDAHADNALQAAVKQTRVLLEQHVRRASLT